jgi:type IV secretory pathway protease TraF
LKRIVAIAGDSVRVSAGGVAVNGRAISGTELRAVDRAGQPLIPTFLGGMQVGAEDVWLLGLDPAVSWDSRYFGPVSIHSVHASAVPILTLAWRSSDEKSAMERSAAVPRDNDVP